jgi:hypothetical protein
MEMKEKPVEEPISTTTRVPPEEAGEEPFETRTRAA